MICCLTSFFVKSTIVVFLLLLVDFVIQIFVTQSLLCF